MYRIFQRAKGAKDNIPAALTNSTEYKDKSSALDAAKTYASANLGLAFFVYEQVVEVKTADPVLVVNDKYLSVDAPR